MPFSMGSICSMPSGIPRRSARSPRPSTRSRRRQERIDQALQSLRDWAAQRAELVIVGDGDLRPVVRRLHNLVIGADVSFTWYEPAEGATDAAAAVKTAATGTLCVEMRRQADAVAVVERVRGIEYMGRPQLVLCTADL